MLNSLDSVARTINRQYQHIGTIMRALLDAYQQLRSEIDLLMASQTHQRWND